jgi:hypothetical protein
MGLARRAALLGMLAPPAEGPWNSTWQAAIDAAPAGAKASLKALAGWSHLKGIQPESVTDETLVHWSNDCRRSPTEAAGLSEILLQTNRASARAGADLLRRLELRKSQGTTRDLLEQYGIKSEKTRSQIPNSHSK